MVMQQYFSPYIGPLRRLTGADYHPYPIFYGTPNDANFDDFFKIYDPRTASELKINSRMQFYDIDYA